MLLEKKTKTILVRIDPNGMITQYFLSHKWQLEEAQKEIGGYIERLPHFNSYRGCKCSAYVDEDGIRKDLPFNLRATRLWEEQLGSFPHYPVTVLGPMLIIISGEKGVEKYERDAIELLTWKGGLK